MDYDPKSGQYVDPAQKCYVDIATGEHFTDLEIDEPFPAPQKPQSRTSALFNSFASLVTNIADAFKPNNAPSKAETRAVIRQKLDKIRNS